MKNAFVGTALGRAAMGARTRIDLVRNALAQNPEKTGMFANDAIAERLLVRMCRPGLGFLDVGAHIGSVFSRVHRTDPTVAVYAIEADTEKVAALRRNHPYCVLFDCAVGEAEGEATFFRNPRRPGYSSLAEQDQGVPHQVRIRPIDALLPEAEIDVVKIDVEGAELGALRGAGGLVARSRPTIMYESALPERNSLGYAPEDVWDWFDAAGYEVFVPDRVAHDAPALGRDTYLDAHVFPRRTRNYFAVARERRLEIRDRARTILKIS